MHIKIKKNSAGSYTYSIGVYRVNVYQVDPNKAYGDVKPMWIAAAEWTNDTYTDPLETKRETIENAKNMLIKAVKSEIK